MKHWRCLLAEAFGTFVLTLVDSGVCIVNPHLGEPLPLLARSFAPAFVVMTMIFSLGEVCGAHINPAVTCAFFLRGVFPTNKVLPYILAQISGAVVAGLLLYWAYGPELQLGLTTPKVSQELAMAFELGLTFLLITTILGTATEANVKGPQSAFPVGFTLIFCGLLGKAATGASMNPARSFGPALVDQDFSNLWIYLTMPFLGGVLAVAWTWLIHGPPVSKEVKAAEGGHAKER